MQRRSVRTRPLLPLNPEIERSLTPFRREARRRNQDILEPNSSSSSGSEEDLNTTFDFNLGNTHQVMGDPRALKQRGTPDPYTPRCGILAPTTEANNFEIKSNFIQLIERRQFSGSKLESPHEHLADFLKYCDTIKANGVTQEYIRLKMFPFSLVGVADNWLNKEVPPGSLTTWDQVTRAFLKRFYNHKKTSEARFKIQGFRQRTGESLCEAWERYKELQRQCPHHEIPKYQLLQTFYGGLSPQSKTSLDAGAGGPIMNKREDEVENIIEEVVRNYEDWYEGDREISSSKGQVHSIEQASAITNLTSQVTRMATQMEQLMKLQSQSSSPSTKGGQGMSTTPSPSSSSSSYNTMPPGVLFCDYCGTYDHDVQHCVYACEVTQSPSLDENVNVNDVEDVNVLNMGMRNMGPRPNFNQGWSWNQQGGGYDNQNQGRNYPNQGFSNHNQPPNPNRYGNQNANLGNQNYGNIPQRPNANHGQRP